MKSFFREAVSSLQSWQPICVYKHRRIDSTGSTGSTVGMHSPRMALHGNKYKKKHLNPVSQSQPHNLSFNLFRSILELKRLDFQTLLSIKLSS